MFTEAFTMRIANLAVQVQPLFASTKEYCRAYLTDREPEAYVSVSREELLREQVLAEREALAENLRIRKFSEPFLERAVIQRKVADALVPRNTLLFHGSAVAVDGAAYLFTAACGTGKSTHTRLWREAFGERAVMVNDDKPFLKLTSGGVFACGAPWSGKHGLDTNICLPLKGICVLYRGAENVIRPLSPEKASEMLHHQSYASTEPTLAEKAAALTDTLAFRVPLWEMECTKDPEAALVAYRAMSALP